MDGRWFKIGGFSALLLAIGISAIENQDRQPASPSVASPLMNALQAMAEPYRLQPISFRDCVGRLDQTIESMKSLRPQNFSRADVAADSEIAFRYLFASRVELHEQMKALFKKKELTEACAVRIRSAFRHIRGIEDFVGTIGFETAQAKLPKGPIRIERQYDPNMPRIDNARITLPQFLPAPRAQFPNASAVEPPSYLPSNALLNPAITAAPGVRSGDILLSRGNANTSALIARMGDEDTQFSHLALVYVDPRTKLAWTIEAHIEFGSIITPISDWLIDGKGRTLVFRHNDADLAHRAAEHMYNRIKSRFDAGNRVKYDFGFNMHDHELLFCSEVAREGYEIASRGVIMVPYFASHLTMKNRDLMNRLGITETQSFIPADMEIDPRFTMIAEWRDFTRLPTLWKKDAILTSIYAWIENDGYEFDSNLALNTKGLLARALRKAGFLKDRMPTYMTQDTIVLNFMLDDVVENLEVLLVDREKAHRKATGYGMTYFDYLQDLGTIRNAVGATASGPFKFLHKP